MPFVHLHVHSDFSFLDGASKLDDLITRVKELGQSAIALTDHGVMHGAIKLVQKCQKAGIKPIVGNELYIINQDITKPYKGKKYHLVVLAKNTTGYKNLCKLTSTAHLHGWQGKGIFARPCINKELLEQHSEGLIILSGCLGGEIPQMILQGKLQEARTIALWYKRVFGDDFYLEIQDHGIRGSGELGDNIENLEKKPDERVVNREISAIALELGIKLVATNDSHYTCYEDREAHQALLCINTGSTLAAPKMQYTGTEYVKSEAEMLELFADHLNKDTVAIAVQNSQEIADKIEEYDLFGKNRLPSYEIPQGETQLSYLKKVTWEGLKKRFKGQRPPENYIQRAKYELEVIAGAQFEEYFLVVSDYMRYAKSQNIPVGAGRGSACGSVVAWAMEITNVDPIHHGLLFERFLNPERKSMPDVDSDFCIERRGEVIQYVTEKYGSNKVAQIATFNMLAPRQALKDVGKVLQIPFYETNQVTELVPVVRGIPTPLKKLIAEDSPVLEFKSRYQTEEDFKQWVDMATKIEGTHKTSGVHAAGVVISREPLDELVPLTRSKDGNISTQYDMGDVEALGLLKMDFLGLKNLTVIQKTLDFLENKNTKLEVEQILNRDRSFHPEWQQLPEDVARSYFTAFKGGLDGVFQLESPGMRQLVKDLQPSSIDDLSLILALYRPGILDAGLLPTFVNRKAGREQVEYLHPMLKPILKSTFGIPVYQEQVMKIAQELAGYSLGEADLLRRAMGKKKPEEMAKQRGRFVSGCIQNDISETKSVEIFEQLALYSSYCFNASHSVAYAYTSWQTLYLRANYPVEFLASVLSGEDDTEKLANYMDACKESGIAILPPHINKSEVSFAPDGNNIRFGLGAIRNVGEEIVNRIITERRSHGEYTSLNNFCDRTPTAAKRAVESLIYAGAFDFINSNRAKLLAQVDSAMKVSKSMAKDAASGQLSLFNLSEVVANSTSTSTIAIQPLALTEQAAKEREMLGVILGETPLSQWRDRVKPIAGSVASCQIGQIISLVCEFSDFRHIYTKNGDEMCFLSFTDGKHKILGVLFPGVYKEFRGVLRDSAAIVLVIGKVEDRKGERQLVVSFMQRIEEVQIAVVKASTSGKEVLARNAVAKIPGTIPVVLKSVNGRKMLKYPSQGINNHKYLKNVGLEVYFVSAGEMNSI